MTENKVDLIYTAGPRPGKAGVAEPVDQIKVHCCLALKMGWMYGIRSTDGVCGAVKYHVEHRPQFIDNDFRDYDHMQHLSVVKRWRPKYATVRDIMTPEQCRAEGIDYYPLEQILDWAEELTEYAQRVIVIPKYDCLDKIPSKFVLGYSVPSAYGGTPLPLSAFQGRPVHLLRGSPKRQTEYFIKLRKDVVSLDNNSVFKISKYGYVYFPDTQKYANLKQIGFANFINPLYIALSINLDLFRKFYSNPDLPPDNQQLSLPGMA